MSIKGITDQIQCPVWLGEAADDMFFKGQPQQVAKALGDRGTYFVLTEEDAAALHCHVGAFVYANQLVFDWLQQVLPRVHKEL